MPARLGRLLTQVEHGDFELSINHEGLSELTLQMQRMVNRIALSVLLAATIIALGLAVVAYHPIGWERFASGVFGLAFPLSLVAGIWLMWNIWRSGRA